MRPLALLLLAAALLPALGAAQPARGQRCLVELLNVDREHARITIAEGVVNEFAGGNVRARCRGLPVRMASDSVALYGGSVAQFVGRVRYTDSAVSMTADYGTYFRDAEKWEARGNVVLTNLSDGSTLRGPMLDYYRVLPPVRDTTILYADQRPTVTLPVKDSTGADTEPYVVIGDRVRMHGQDRVWVGGRVMIDRSDFRGRGDSLFLDTGAGSAGALIGQASMRRTGSDSFDLVGRRIDLALDNKELTYVTARDSARMITGEMTLTGDGIGIDIERDSVQHTTAWGTRMRPEAVAPDYLARGDSLMFDTPAQRLRAIHAFGQGWLGTRPDSAGGERDWVAGDTVRAAFGDPDSTGSAPPALERLEAHGSARAFYRTPTPGGGPASISYSVADLIIITMRPGDSTGVDSVFALGVRDGVHLQPPLRRAAPAALDSVPRPRTDTVPSFRRERRR